MLGKIPLHFKLYILFARMWVDPRQVGRQGEIHCMVFLLNVTIAPPDEWIGGVWGRET